MKELSLYKIRDLALKSRRSVYSIQQLANLVGKPKSVAKVYASRLVKNNLAKRLLRGKIAFIEDDLVLASQLVEPAYVSLSTALLFHGLLKQTPAYTECVTPRNSRTYGGMKIIYHKIPAALFFGYNRYQKSGSYAFIAEPEKAVLDAVYLNAISKNDVNEIVEKCGRKKFALYLKSFNGRGVKKLKRWLL